VDRDHIAVAVLKALAYEGALALPRVEEAIAHHGIDTGDRNPWKF